MKPSMLKGTGSAFYLYGLDKEDTNVFDEWNAMVIVPSLKEKAIASRMSFNYLQEDWLTHDFIGDRDDYHTYEIEWTPDYLAYKVDGTEIRRRYEVAEL
jgi:beta-glucanase (GH16 family)